MFKNDKITDAMARRIQAEVWAIKRANAKTYEQWLAESK